MDILLHAKPARKLSFPCYDASGINREKAAMVSGWDKSPGPDNDYAPKPMTAWAWVKVALLAAAALGTMCWIMSR